MKKALLVGINYIGTNVELQGCINDTIHLSDVLVSQYGFHKEDIVLLNDGGYNAVDVPTKQNIIMYMKKLVENVKEGDTLVFHYSGHGTTIRDVNYDERDGLDEVLCPVDYQNNGFISDDAILENLIKLVPQGVKLLCIIDACHSGSMCDLKYNFKYTGLPLSTSDYSQWADKFRLWQENKNVVNGNVIMFSGCLDDQTSADAYINNRFQGAFTFSLIKILQNNNFQIKNKYLLKYIVATLVQDGFDQRAQFSSSSLGLFDEYFTL